MTVGMPKRLDPRLSSPQAAALRIKMQTPQHSTCPVLESGARFACVDISECLV